MPSRRSATWGSPEWGLYKDEVGWFAGAQNPDGTFSWRSLSTPNRQKAERWLEKAMTTGSHHLIGVEVWHRKEPNFGFGPKGYFPGDFEAVALVDAFEENVEARLERAYRLTQSIEEWWGFNPGVTVLKPRGPEVPNYIVGHIRSTSVGDVLVDLLTLEAWFVDTIGFTPWAKVSKKGRMGSFDPVTKKWMKTISWKGETKNIECREHWFAHTGKTPGTGPIRCALCGKPGDRVGRIPEKDERTGLGSFAMGLIPTLGPKGWKEKLDPRRFPFMSPKMGAIVAYVIGKKGFTNPEIEDMVTTSDGAVLARNEGDIGHNVFIGSWDDLFQNWTRLLEAAGVEDEEWSEAMAVFHRKVNKRTGG